MIMPDRCQTQYLSAPFSLEDVGRRPLCRTMYRGLTVSGGHYSRGLKYSLQGTGPKRQ